MLRRASSSETLICGPRIVYPLDVLLKGVAWWIFLLVCAWLGHRIIPNHVWAQFVIRSNPVSPKRGVQGPLTIKFQDLRFLEIAHVCEGGHTWEPCFAHFSIPPHFNTHTMVH